MAGEAFIKYYRWLVLIIKEEAPKCDGIISSIINKEKRDMIHNTRQKVNETSTTNNCKEAILFNSDTLSKIISYLSSSVDLLNLALTCKRFGVSNNEGESSLIEESAHLLVQDIATDEQLAALPHYDGETSLADYHYLQLLRSPLTFDQLVAGSEYVNDLDKSFVRHKRHTGFGSWSTAFSNNILRAGKHYVSFTSRLIGWAIDWSLMWE